MPRHRRYSGGSWGGRFAGGILKAGWTREVAGCEHGDGDGDGDGDDGDDDDDDDSDDDDDV